MTSSAKNSSKTTYDQKEVYAALSELMSSKTTKDNSFMKVLQRYIKPANLESTDVSPKRNEKDKKDKKNDDDNIIEITEIPTTKKNVKKNTNEPKKNNKNNVNQNATKTNSIQNQSVIDILGSDEESIEVFPKTQNVKKEKKVPEKKVLEKKIPEKKITEKKVIEKKVPEKKIPEKKIQEKKIEEKNLLEEITIIEEPKKKEKETNNSLLGKKRNSSLNTSKNSEKTSKISEKNQKEKPKEISKEKYTTPSLTILSKLKDEYGIELILDTLCKDELDPSIKLDSMLKAIIDPYGGEKFIYMLLKLIVTSDNTIPLPTKNISIIEENEIEDVIKNYKKSENKKNEIIEKITEKKNEIVKINNCKNNNYKKDLGLGMHFHKDTDGHVYKFYIHHFMGGNICSYYCSDKGCGGNAKYDIDSMSFKMERPHSKAYDDHQYAINLDTEKDKNIYKELENSDNYNDCQLFKKEGKRQIKYY